MEAKAAVPATPPVFAGAGVPYAAFSLRDPYYREMARLVLTEVKQVSRAINGSMQTCIDLGAGVGVSTMELLSSFERIIAVEPEESMREILGMNLFCHPKVTIKSGKAEELSAVLDDDDIGVIDVVAMCQVMHNLKDVLPTVLTEISKVLCEYGVLAFDLGPSNFEFTTHKISDHRSGEPPAADEIMTELSHPLYLIAHEVVLETVRKRYPDFDRENLWPPAGKKFSREELKPAFEAAGMEMVRVTEIMVPISGERVLEFLKNAWAVFFRWKPLCDLPIKEKISAMEESIKTLCSLPDFDELVSVVAYHPTAIITAVKK
ncbi:MAG: methyltransferase domain-containing protein [Patescibacteria group bacterium]